MSSKPPNFGTCAARALALVAVTLIVTTAPTSHAAPRADRFEGPQSVVSLRFGLGLPTGVIGATASYEPTSWFITQVGVGQGLAGPQVAAGLGFRLPIASFIGINVVAEYSFGKTVPLSLFCIFDCRSGDARDTQWVSFTVQPEFRFGQMFVLRPQIGFAKQVSGTVRSFESDAEIFITGVSAGFRFEL